MKWFYGILSLSALTWAIGSSMNYAIPARSFLGVLDKETFASASDPIWANNRVLAAAVNFRLWLRGDDRRAHVLPDDPDIIGEPGQWILWSSSFDDHYPTVREVFGYATKRSFYPAPSFVMPDDMRAVRSAFTPVSVLRTGPYPSPAKERITGANVAPLAKVTTDPLDDRVGRIADYAWLTAVRWQGDEAQVTFDLARPGALSVYGFGGIYHRGSDNVQPVSWKVDGSVDGERWFALDQRYDVDVSAQRGVVTYFKAREGLPMAKHVRFTLKGRDGQPFVGLTEIEIYLGAGANGS